MRAHADAPALPIAMDLGRDDVSVLHDTWVLSACCAALLLRLIRLDAAPLWFDETMTARWVSLPWAEMVRTAVGDNHPPLYFMMLKAWSELAGTSPWTLRLPSVLLSCLVVPLTASIAASLSGRYAARWAAWLAAGAPFLIHHGQEVRMYGLVAALAAAHLLLLTRFVTGTSRALGWSFVLTAAALVASHYYTMFFVGGEMLVLCILWPRPLRTWVPATLATGVLIGGALLAAMVLARHEAGGGYDMGWLAFPGAVWSMLSGYALLPSSEELHASGWRVALPYLPVAVVGGAALVTVALRGLRAFGSRARVLVVVTLATAIVGPFAIGFVLPVGLNPRYFSAALPPFLVLLAAGAPASLGANRRSAAMGALVAVMALGAARHLSDPGHGREDIRAAADWLDVHVPVDEEILVTSGEMEYLARFHWPARRFRLYPGPGVVVAADSAESVAEGLPFSGGDRAIYLVGRSWVSDPAGALQRVLSERFARCDGAELRGIRILCLRPPAADASRR